MAIGIRPNETRTMKTYQQLAKAIQWQKNAKGDWQYRAGDLVDRIVSDLLPSGSGINNGLTLEECSTENRIVLSFGYHHMNENGMYDGWTDHKAIITPSLVNGFDLRITGRDRNQIKGYLHETFECALSEDHAVYAWLPESE